MKNRDRTSNLINLESTQDTNAQQSTEVTDTQESTQITNSHQTIPESSQHSPQNVHVNDESSSTVILEESESSLSAQRTRKRKNDDDIIHIIRDLENNHKQRQEERDIRRNQEKKHPIEIFFQSMAETAKPMPTFMQNRIKRKVLEIVCEAEEELESYIRTPTPTYGYSTPSAASTSDQQYDQSSTIFEQL